MWRRNSLLPDTHRSRKILFVELEKNMTKMTKMTKEELKQILEVHAKWVKGESGSRADLSKMDLSGADLSEADLNRANLNGADLSGANLNGANLSKANLSRAILYGADLRGADLSKVILSGADLSGTNLRGANLSKAEDIIYILSQSSILPESGPIWGWKKCKDGVLVKLVVGDTAKRSHATGRKCRAEHVKVLEVIGAEVGISSYDNKTEYRV